MFLLEPEGGVFRFDPFAYLLSHMTLIRVIIITSYQEYLEVWGPPQPGDLMATDGRAVAICSLVDGLGGQRRSNLSLEAIVTRGDIIQLLRRRWRRDGRGNRGLVAGRNEFDMEGIDRP